MGHIEKSQSGHRAHLFGFVVGYVVCLNYWLPWQEGWQDDFLRMGAGMICAIASDRAWRWWVGLPPDILGNSTFCLKIDANRQEFDEGS